MYFIYKMKLMTSSNCITLLNLINLGFKYVMETSQIYKIDESHALKHSLEVYGFAKKIYEKEIINNEFLTEQKKIIFMSAIGHDMCDKKYMNEKEGIEKYKNYLLPYMEIKEIEIIGKIIETMSYSKVKVNGYLNLNEYQLAYHIVREADLLSAYDIDRCIMYKMFHDNCDYNIALTEAIQLFDNRIFTMRKDNLFITDFSKKESLILEKKAIMDVECLKNI